MITVIKILGKIKVNLVKEKAKEKAKVREKVKEKVKIKVSSRIVFQTGDASDVANQGTNLGIAL